MKLSYKYSCIKLSFSN